jgi:predicted AlkP superfamily phosphohydrolase/phosphomutase
MKDFKIWDILSQNEKESCIVNVRMLYPVEELKGVMISGNPAPSEESDYVYPKNLKEKIAGFRYVEEDRLSEELTADPQRNKEKILELRIKMTKNRYRVFRELNAEKRYDFSFFWIGGTDFMGHWFWGDEASYLRYFKEVDLILEDVLKTFDGWEVLVISDHGMQGVQKKKFYVNTWLEKIGYLKYRGNALSQTIRKAVAPKLSVLLSKERKEKVIKLLKRGSADVEDKAKGSSKGGYAITKLEYGSVHNIDWERTKAYLVNDWGIDIKMDSDSNEYHRIRDDIVEKLKKLTDEEGKRIVKNVWRKEEIFNGPYLDEIPDIVFIPMEDYGMGILPSSKITGIINRDQYERSDGRYFRGDHEGAIDGILMATGPHIKHGEEINKAGLMDIMPTVLHMLDVDVPNDVDGVVLKELFKEDSSFYKRKVHTRDYGKPQRDADALSSEENEEIIESLKQMGYM